MLIEYIKLVNKYGALRITLYKVLDKATEVFESNK